MTLSLRAILLAVCTMHRVRLLLPLLLDAHILVSSLLARGRVPIATEWLLLGAVLVRALAVLAL